MSRARGRQSLMPWVCGPVLGLIVLLLVAEGLPTPECGEGGGASDGELTAFFLLLAITIGGCLLGALARLAALWRRPGAPAWRSRLLVALPPLFIALVGLFALVGVDALVAVGLIAGAALTALALLVLILAWTLGQGVDRGGILVPVYLLGAGLLCYPALAVLVAVEQSGLAC